MHVLDVVDVNEALPLALEYLRDHGTVEQTRNGPAMVAPGPVATVYRQPRRRVLFDATRDANPFFHLFESLWILAGRQDVRTLSWFNSRIANYSDDGYTFHGAYGHRLRHHFEVDQLELVAEELRYDNQNRRAVLQIWDCSVDLGAGSKDIPCNDLVMFRVRDDSNSFRSKSLDITVCCRSNDAVWGAYGANAVQFSMLQEYIANKIGVGVGEYTQMSHNLHVYMDNPYWLKHYAGTSGGAACLPNPYMDGAVEITPLDGICLSDAFDEDLADMFKIADGAADLHGFCKDLHEYREFSTEFFSRIVRPMLALYHYREATSLLETQYDWHRAAFDWLERRATKEAA